MKYGRSLCGQHHLVFYLKQDEREQVEKALQEVVRDAAALRRDFVRLGLTNSQRNALEGASVFRETELGYMIEDSEAAGLDMALLAQVGRMRTTRRAIAFC